VCAHAAALPLRTRQVLLIALLVALCAAASRFFDELAARACVLPFEALLNDAHAVRNVLRKQVTTGPCGVLSRMCRHLLVCARLCGHW
jgi:hypothetical protein